MSEALYCLECNRTVKPTPAGHCPRCDRHLGKSSIDGYRSTQNGKNLDEKKVHSWATGLHATIDNYKKHDHYPTTTPPAKEFLVNPILYASERGSVQEP
jgi:hypothetical protein